MIDVGSKIYSLLSTDSTLISLIGSSDNILSSHPGIITTFPVVIFREENQGDGVYEDDLPISFDSTIVIDVYIKDDSPTPIVEAISNIMTINYWSCIYNSDVPDPNTTARHRNVRYARSLIAEDV